MARFADVARGTFASGGSTSLAEGGSLAVPMPVPDFYPGVPVKHGRRYYGETNQSEMGVPPHSPYGEGMRVREAYASGLQAQTYVPGPYPFLDQFGDVYVPPDVLIPVTHREPYQGISPLDLQTQVRKPHPWEDLSRGRP